MSEFLSVAQNLKYETGLDRVTGLCDAAQMGSQGPVVGMRIFFDARLIPMHGSFEKQCCVTRGLNYDVRLV